MRDGAFRAITGTFMVLAILTVIFGVVALAKRHELDAERGRVSIAYPSIGMTGSFTFVSGSFPIATPPKRPCPRCGRMIEEGLTVSRTIYSEPVFDGCKTCLVDLLEEVAEERRKR